MPAAAEVLNGGDGLLNKEKQSSPIGMGDDCAPPQQSWTRLRMDPFHQMDDMRITSFALRYYVNPPEANCPTIYPTNPTTRLQAQGNSWPAQQWRTDVESDLRGINRFGSRVRCDEKLQNPDTNPVNNVPLENAQDEDFPMKFNRLDNGPCTLRSTGWNRWQPLFHDPQKTFEQPFDYFVPSRDLDKQRQKSNPHILNKPHVPSQNPMGDSEKQGQRDEKGSVQAAF